MRSAAVVDFGSARAKLTFASACSQDEPAQVEQIKWDTGLGDRAASPESKLSTFNHVLFEIKQKVDARSARIFKSVATQAFREDSLLRNAADLATSMLGDVQILDPLSEGELFWEGISSTVARGRPVTVIDVGGGSVQVAWSKGKAACFSAPVGTYAVESLFQSSKELLSLDEGLKIYDHVLREFALKLVDAPLGLPLIVGSNCMQDFFRSAGKFFDVSGSLSNFGPSVSSAELFILKDIVVGKPYSSVKNAYPENAGFMYGADKALVIMCALSSALKPSIIVPTNESLSSALARSGLQSLF